MTVYRCGIQFQQIKRRHQPAFPQHKSSNVSAVFFLIRLQAALAASMVSSKPPFV
jgi:hypothetical protein